jgi:DNA polymerase
MSATVRDDAAEFSPSATAPADPAGRLRLLQEELGECTRCNLCNARSHVVFGAGNPAARLMFIGEAPGADEDRQGEPFVGRAGQLLTRIIQAIGMQRRDVYIANIIKCRPPGNRDPQDDEISTCIPFLKQQIEIISPQVICTLGRIAAHALLGTDTGITRLRGHFHTYAGIMVMPTYHPSYLLRAPEKKKEAWIDMQMVQKLLEGDGKSRADVNS